MSDRFRPEWVIDFTGMRTQAFDDARGLAVERHGTAGPGVEDRHRRGRGLDKGLEVGPGPGDALPERLVLSPQLVGTLQGSPRRPARSILPRLSADLLLRDARGERQRILQADQMVWPSWRSWWRRCRRLFGTGAAEVRSGDVHRDGSTLDRHLWRCSENPSNRSRLGLVDGPASDHRTPAGRLAQRGWTPKYSTPTAQLSRSRRRRSRRHDRTFGRIVALDDLQFDVSLSR